MFEKIWQRAALLDIQNIESHSLLPYLDFFHYQHFITAICYLVIHQQNHKKLILGN